MARCESCGISMSGSQGHDDFCESNIEGTREKFEKLKEACKLMTEALIEIRDTRGGLVAAHGDALDAGLSVLD